MRPTLMRRDASAIKPARDTNAHGACGAQDELSKLFEEGDANKDQLITFDEFIKMMDGSDEYASP